MSRNVIAGIVAVAIAALTAALYFITASTLQRPMAREARALIKRVPEQAQNNATLTALDTYNKAEELSHRSDVVSALRTTEPTERARSANLAFQWFRGKREREGSQADLLAFVDKTGAIVAMDGVANPVAGEFKKDGKLVWKSLELATAQPTLMTEVWNYPGKGLLRVGIGTVVDDTLDVDGKPVVLGAVVLAYSITSKAARAQLGILGAHVAYFDGGQVFASSFKRGDDSEDTRMQGALAPILKQDLVANALAKGQAGKFIETSAEGTEYLVSAVRLPRLSLEPLPEGYPAATAGILVLTEADRIAPEHGRVGVFIIVLGVVALALALGGIFLASQRILDQVDQIELGVAEIINGNLERTFRPVGDDLDGVANGLNVMLARLLGRPEPGEEEFDDDGNPIVPGRVEFDDPGDNRSVGDPDLAALAQESEPDYYKRVYTEYTEARRASGNPDDVSFEGFIAKLRVNEGKLKAQYQCRAVRFRVVSKDGKVSLKPVPIV